jgi:lipoyl(octanoyl) transferase
VQDLQAGNVSDALFFVEHPHILTLGRGASRANILWDQEACLERDLSIFETGRGGDVTYHGPGQLVGYPIINLAPDRCDLHRYVRDLEEVLIRTVSDYGIQAERNPGKTGVWVGPEKIASIGVRVARWVTSHGFALNVSTDLSYFSSIHPCGIEACSMTSLEKKGANFSSLEAVSGKVDSHFREIFGFSAPRSA